MGKNRFSEEQQIELSKNPYIEKVSETTITYAKEFKEHFQREYSLVKGASNILMEMGINPKLLGKKRIDSIVRRNKIYAERENGNEDLRGKVPKSPKNEDLTPTEENKKLKHQIEILRQENEFLKKNEFLDNLAAIRANRKQHQQRNSNSLKK